MTSRRTLLGASLAAAGGLGLPAAAHGNDETPPKPREALTRLLDGNTRWVSGALAHRDPAADRRRRVAAAQHPFAVIVGCIDSRVPPEYVFDTDLGELFVVRTAGESLDALVHGSIEYGPAHGTPLVFVLGHTRCGAVRATIESIEDGVVQPGHLGKIVAALRPAYVAARVQPWWSRDRRVDEVAAAQVRLTVAALRADPLLATLIHQGQTKVTGGLYHLDTGIVGRLPAGSAA